MSRDRIIALGRIVCRVETSPLRNKASAVLVRQRDVSKKIEQLCLRLVDAGIAGNNDVGAAMGFHFGTRALERHQILPVWHLMAYRGCHDIGPAEPVGP